MTAHDQMSPMLLQFSPIDQMKARLVVHNDRHLAIRIHPRVFGNFFEHLGFATQAVSAQCLRNPALAPGHNLSEEQRKRLLANGCIAAGIYKLDEDQRLKLADWYPSAHSTGFGLLLLDDQTEHGLPLPWFSRGDGSAKGGEPGRIGPAVRLEPGGGQVVLGQGFFPPLRGVAEYEGVLWARASGEKGELVVQLRRREKDDVLAEETLVLPDEYWRKMPFHLSLPQDALEPGEPVDFCIVARGDVHVWVDRAVLYPSDHIDGFDPDVVRLVQELGPPVLRWPGGNFASGYHFWHGIGETDRRQTLPNPAWGGIEDHLFGTDEFLQFCQLVGAEPHLCVNMGDGSAGEAAAWVEYVNGPPESRWGRLRAANGHPEPYGVRLWEVGNEIYGPWQIGHCGPEENTKRYREWSAAMRAVDPDIELLATGSCFDFEHPEDHWHEVLLRDGGKDLDCIALHELPNNRPAPGQTTEDLWMSLMADTHRWEHEHIPGLLELARSVRPEKPIDIAITEWGILGHPEHPQVRNYGGAVYAALFLNMGMRLSTHLRVANATALFHGGCIRKAGPFLYCDPQVEVIRRYTQMAGGVLIPAHLEGPGYQLRTNGLTGEKVPYLDAVSVQLPGGRYQTVVVNRHPHDHIPLEVSVQAGNIKVVGCESMEGHNQTAVNTPLNPKRISASSKEYRQDGAHTLKLDCAPCSVTWIEWKDS